MSDTEETKLRILVNSNSNMSRGKYAAQAVHAALTAAGVHPGLPVIVLGGQRDDVLRCKTVIRDAGKTEVEPGTETAGTDWEPEMEYAIAREEWPTTPVFRQRSREAAEEFLRNPPIQESRTGWHIIQRPKPANPPWSPVHVLGPVDGDQP